MNLRTKGEGVQKPKNFADVFNGSPLKEEAAPARSEEEEEESEDDTATVALSPPSFRPIHR